MYLFKLCQRKRVFKVVHKDGKTYLPKLIQLEAEHLFQGPHFDVTQHLNDTLFVFMVAMFYLPLLPAGASAAMLAFLTNVIYVKQKLLTRHSKPPHLESSIIELVSKFVPWMVYCSSVMQLLYVRWTYWHMQSVSN